MPWIRKKSQPHKTLFYHDKELEDVVRRGDVLEYVEAPVPEPDQKQPIGSKKRKVAAKPSEDGDTVFNSDFKED